MALSNEAVIGLVGVIIMCFPLARYLFRFATRRWNATGRDMALIRAPRDILPRHEVPNHVLPHAYARYMEAGFGFTVVRQFGFLMQGELSELRRLQHEHLGRLAS